VRVEARPSSPATRLKRHPERGRYERAELDAILDEGLICHLGFIADGRPLVLPTIHARSGDVVYIHGSSVSRMQKALQAGVECCLTVTLLDGLVMARAAFTHSMNYRSAVVLGRAEPVVDPDEKNAAFAAIVDHVAMGRWAESRPPNRKEIKATSILRLPITEWSAKVRTGGPKDDPDDLDLDVWAGVLPLSLVPGSPVPSDDLKPGIAPPGYLTRYRRNR
jgi:uncharacterized protein